MAYERAILEALKESPRWHIVHWGGPGTSTLMCLWVAGKETLVAVDGESAFHLGRQYPVTQLVELLRRVQILADEEALASQDAQSARRRLLDMWLEHPADGSMGAWEFPRGGYLRWHRDGEALHIEASEGGPYHQTMPEPLTAMLVDLGWNLPTEEFRNCWLQPEPPELPQAAAIGVLTTLAAFGYDKPPDLG